MPSYRGNLHEVEPLLEEAAGGLVPQVMEREPSNAGLFGCPLEGMNESAAADREYLSVDAARQIS